MQAQDSTAAGGVAAVEKGPERPALAWRSLFSFYADNTEFFTPYRLGETIMGSQFTTALTLSPRRDVEVLAGIFGDYRYASPHLLDQVKPILSFRWRGSESKDRQSIGVLGTLITERRHGFLEPLQTTTLELTRPIEYGAQWIERGRWLTADAFLNWQRLLTRQEREVFDAGGVAALHPRSWIDLEAQLHWVHHGGQRYDGALPVTGSVASAFGARVRVPRRSRGTATARSDSGSRALTANAETEFPFVELAFFRVTGNGNIDPGAPSGEPTKGHGAYYRGGVSLTPRTALFGIYWRARDFLSAEGDRNYSSEGFTYARYYRSRRTYVELGLMRRLPLSQGLALDTEVRLHRMDHQRSTDPILGKTWEYSYRLVARVPVDIQLGAGRTPR